MEINVDPQEQPNPEYKNNNKLIDKIKNFLTAVWKFIKSPVFLKNVGVLFVFAIIGFFILSFALKIYTNHGESMQVDNYIGMDKEDAERKIRKKDFLIEVKETYGKPAGKVTLQYPDPLSRVKEGRTIYLTVKNGKMEEVKIPDFSDKDNYKSYSGLLKGLGLIPKFETVFNAKLSEKTILHLEYKGEELTGLKLRRGKTAIVGDTVQCIITTRYSTTVSLPNLICLDFEAAAFLLETHQLQAGSIHGDVANRNNAYIWKQEPAYVSGKQISKGSKINIYLTDTYPAGCD